MAKRWQAGSISLLSLGLLTSCMAVQNPHHEPRYSAQMPPQAQHMAAPPVVDNRMFAEMNGLRERVRRVERAMIRMDRRMQLIERNELSRMQGDAMGGTMTPPPSGMFQPMNAPQLPSAPMQLAPTGQPGFQPVNFEQPITSTLGVAPRQPVGQQMAALQTRRSHLPSLADRGDQEATQDVSIWTISYENDKIWPGREQLSSSRDVIESLRSGQPVALFARGADPSSHYFRERVRAISKYLSKVTDVDNVPIASMSAEHLGKDTIELLATR